MAPGAHAVVGQFALVQVLHGAPGNRLRQHVAGNVGSGGKLTLGVLAQADGAVALGVEDTAVVHADSIDDIRAGGLEHGGQCRTHYRGRVVAVVAHDVVENPRAVRVGLRLRVVGGIAGQGEIGEGDAHGVVAGDDVALHHHVVTGHYQHPGANRDIGNQGALDGKILVVVVDDEIVAYQHVATSLDGQARGNKGQDTAGIVVDEVGFHQGVAAVFDLDPGDAFEHLVEHHIDIVGHAHVDRRVLDTGNDVVGHNAVLAQLGENPVDAGVDDKVVADNEIVTRLAHYAVALVMGDVEVLHGDAVAGVQYRVIAQPLPLQHRVPALFNHAGEGDVVLVDVHGFLVDAGHHLDDRAGAGRHHGVLDRLALADDDQFAAGGGHEAAHQCSLGRRRGHFLGAGRGEGRLRLAVHLDHGRRLLARLADKVSAGQQDNRAYYHRRFIHRSVLHLRGERPGGRIHCEPAACPRATQPVRGV